MLGKFWDWILGIDREAGDLEAQMAMPRFWRFFWYIVILAVIIGTGFAVFSCAPREADAAPAPPDRPMLAVTADSTSVHLSVFFHAPVDATGISDSAGVNAGGPSVKQAHLLAANATEDHFTFPKPAGDSLSMYACLRSLREITVDSTTITLISPKRKCEQIVWHRPVVLPDPPEPPVIDSLRVGWLPDSLYLWPNTVTLEAGQPLDLAGICVYDVTDGKPSLLTTGGDCPVRYAAWLNTLPPGQRELAVIPDPRLRPAAAVFGPVRL